MKTFTLALAILPTLFSLSAARAAALDGDSPETVVAAPSEDARGTADDPNIDRAFLLPTAMTQPAGTGTYNNYELLLHGFTYAATDHVQLTLTVLPPMFSGLPFIGVAAAKWQFVSTPRLHMAIQGSVGMGRELDRKVSGEGNNPTVGTFGGGLFASVCVRADCSSLISASATYQYAVPDSGARSAQVLIYGGSIVHSVSEHVKLLGEVASMALNDSTRGLDNMPGAFFSYGIRLHNKSLASDIGFVRPILKNGGSDEFLMGLPFASVSYRWM